MPRKIITNKDETLYKVFSTTDNKTLYGQEQNQTNWKENFILIQKFRMHWLRLNSNYASWTDTWWGQVSQALDLFQSLWNR